MNQALGQLGTTDNIQGKKRTLKSPVVDGEGEVVAWSREAITSSPSKLTCITSNNMCAIIGAALLTFKKQV